MSNWQENDEDNNAVFAFRGGTFTLTAGKDRPLDPSFGILRPGERFVLCLDFKLGTMMRDEYLSTAHFVSPLVYAPGTRKGPASIVVCDFVRPAAEHGEAIWQSGKTSVLPLDFDSLAAIVRDNRGPTYLRTIAVTLAADLHKQRACEALRTRLQTVNESHGEVRAAAIQALGALKDAAAGDALASLLSDGKQPKGIRRLAALALANIGEAKAVPSLRAATRDSEQLVSSAAISALGVMTRAEALDALSQLLADATFARSSEAAKALGKHKAVAIEVLAKGTSDAREDVAAAAVEALGEVLKPEPPKNAEDLGDDKVKQQKVARLREGAPAITGQPAAVAFDALQHSLGDKRSKVAGEAADALSGIPGTQASRVLLQALEAEPQPTAKVVQAIGTRRESQAEGRLVQLAGKGTPDLRIAAIHALKELKTENARDALARILSDAAEPENVRRAALETLETLTGGPPEAILSKVGGSPTDSLRWACLERLCKSSAAASQDLIRRTLTETDAKQQFERESLKRSFASATRSSDRTPAERLGDSSPEVHRRAADDVAEKKDRGALAALKQAVKAEQDRTTLWRMKDALVALQCRDRDLAPALVAKLKRKAEASDTDVTLPAASILRYVTGMHNGPFEGETDEERAEDVAVWEGWRL